MIWFFNLGCRRLEPWLLVESSQCFVFFHICRAGLCVVSDFACGQWWEGTLVQALVDWADEKWMYNYESH